MYYRKNSVTSVCRVSRVRTPNRKFWCDAFCLRMASAFGFIARICRGSLILFFRNTKLSYSLTDVFGMDTKIADLQLCLKPTTIFELPKYPAMSRETKLLTPNLLKWDGELLNYGNAN